MTEPVKYADLARKILDIKVRAAGEAPDGNGKRKVELDDDDIKTLQDVGELLKRLNGVMDLDQLCLTQAQLQAVMLAFGTLLSRAADGKLGPPGPVGGH